MALDGIILNAISHDLQKLVPAKINRIQQVSDDEIIFTIHHQGKKRLLISCHSKYNRINLTERTYKTIDYPNNFVMVLRKHLDNALITNISQIGLDRILRFELTGYDDISDKHQYFLYLELMGKYANLILVDDNGDIIDCLKRIPPYMNSTRILHPGAKYHLPTAHQKQNPFDLPKIDLDNSLVKQLHGFSPILDKEVKYRMAVLKEDFKDIMEEIQNSNTLYLYPQEFHIIELKHLDVKAHIYPLEIGLDYIYGNLEEEVRIKQQSGDLIKYVKKELTKEENKLIKLERTLDEALNSSINAKYGELLYAYQHQLPNHQTSVEVVDFETGESITIPLDPKLTINQNAKKYFHKYNKSKNAKIEVAKQIDICTKKIQYLQAINEQLGFANVEDALEIKEELVNKGFYFKNHKVTRRKKNTKPHFLTLKIEDTLIYVGKNNVQNDYLTFKLAHKQDTWLHVKDLHGAHVLIKNSNPDEKLLRIGALLAAYYSKGRLSSSVPVNYCPVKNLKKIKNSPLGKVALSNYKTIYIDPDELSVQELLKKYQVK